MAYVYSTASADIQYGIPNKSATPNAPTSYEQFVIIKGGANVIGKNLVTPKGVVTEVSDAQLAICRADPAFARHEAAGFIKVDKRKVNADKVAAKEMAAKDKSAQLTADDKLESNPTTGQLQTPE